MNRLNARKKARDGRARLPFRGSFISCVVVAMLALFAGAHASAQSRESATAGRTFIWVGGGVSDYYLQYGGVKNLGLTGFVDADTRRKLGIEAEGRWLDYRQTNNIHAETYLAGPRYHFNVNRVQPYVKGLAGLGKFNFPYNYATGKYFVVGAGGGADYFITPRLSVRADFEYQYWPQFTFGAMSAGGVSVNLRYLILR